MKVNLVKAVANQYPYKVKLAAIMLAMKYNANHASSRKILGYWVSANTIRRWLRENGMEHKINSYHWKY